MTYVEAPGPLTEAGSSIFLAGGITNCPDWQSEAVKLISDRTHVFNPRRANFPIHDPDAAEEQITWEFNALHEATCILFWFPVGAIQPIALYELGRYVALGRPIAVGRDDSYERRQDVDVQMKLAKPDLPIYNTLAQTVEQAVTVAQLWPN